MTRRAALALLILLTTQGCHFALDTSCSEGRNQCPGDTHCISGLCRCVDERCPEGQRCSENRCECFYTCTLGSTQCYGDTVVVCEETPEGCPYFETLWECDPAGDGCQRQDGVASCECYDTCTRNGTRRCEGGVLETCSRNRSGCLHWLEEHHCAEEGLRCDYREGEWQCVPCVDQAWEGDVEIGINADMEELIDYTSITGNLDVRSNQELDLSPLSCLREVTGNVELAASQPIDASGLGALESIGGNLVVIGHCLPAQLSFPALESVDGMLRLANNSAISSFAAPSLSRIGTDLNINRNWNLERLRMESLTSVGEDFLIFDNRTLPTCEAEAIRGFQRKVRPNQQRPGRHLRLTTGPARSCLPDRPRVRP